MMRTLEQPRKPDKGIDKFFFCAVVGCAGVGKSTFLTRLKTGLFVETYEKSFLPQTHVFDFTTNSNQVLRFHAYEFSGQKCGWAEQYIKMIKALEESKCAIYIHDQTDESTEAGITRFWRLIEGDNGIRLPGVVLAAKTDLDEKRNENKFYFHTVHQLPLLKLSSKCGQVDDVKLFKPFLILARQLMKDETLEFLQYPVPDRRISIDEWMITLKRELGKQLEAALQELFLERDLPSTSSRLSFPFLHGNEQVKHAKKIPPSQNLGRKSRISQDPSSHAQPLMSQSSKTQFSPSIESDLDDKENSGPFRYRLIRNPIASLIGKPPTPLYVVPSSNLEFHNATSFPVTVPPVSSSNAPFSSVISSSTKVPPPRATIPRKATQSLVAEKKLPQYAGATGMIPPHYFGARKAPANGAAETKQKQNNKKD
ncbi:unnamed protein product [Orchesella dallaii]|uniref:Uncharacterized protein n=1 Tax=Orchesella dallaii TaxID=48710 RepID=A0ABP1QCP5_9HEXA